MLYYVNISKGSIYSQFIKKILKVIFMIMFKWSKMPGHKMITLEGFFCLWRIQWTKFFSELFFLENHHKNFNVGIIALIENFSSMVCCSNEEALCQVMLVQTKCSRLLTKPCWHQLLFILEEHVTTYQCAFSFSHRIK